MSVVIIVWTESGSRLRLGISGANQEQVQLAGEEKFLRSEWYGTNNDPCDELSLIPLPCSALNHHQTSQEGIAPPERQMIRVLAGANVSRIAGVRSRWHCVCPFMVVMEASTGSRLTEYLPPGASIWMPVWPLVTHGYTLLSFLSPIFASFFDCLGHRTFASPFARSQCTTARDIA